MRAANGISGSVSNTFFAYRALISVLKAFLVDPQVLRVIVHATGKQHLWRRSRGNGFRNWRTGIDDRRYRSGALASSQVYRSAPAVRNTFDPCTNVCDW